MRNFKIYKNHIFFILPILIFANAAPALPFRNNHVCIPVFDPNASALEFKIRDAGSCEANEQWMAVTRSSDGITLINPAPLEETPLNSEQEEDLKKMKKFYGGEK